MREDSRVYRISKFDRKNAIAVSGDRDTDAMAKARLRIGQVDRKDGIYDD